jgi:hypothetical protein
MKKQIVFIVIYHLIFILLTIGAVIKFDSSKTTELLSYAVWGNFLYIIFGIVTWIIVENILKKINNLKHKLIAKFILGLVFLYVFMFFAGGGQILLISLIAFNKNQDSSWISLMAHIIYIISFLIASCILRLFAHSGTSTEDRPKA